MAEALPHVLLAFNAITVALLLSALTAIRSGRRDLHKRLMLGAVLVGVLFVAAYILQTSLVGHRRFPGDDWVRTFFLVLLATHTVLAVAVVPLVFRALYLGLKSRFSEHRRIVRFAFPIWLYVAVTGAVIYWMNNHLRPPT